MRIFSIYYVRINERGGAMRILVAEDERDLNALIVKRLKQEKYSVDACFDGEAVFDYIRNAEYDVLILDIMMPKLDGLSVVKKLRDMGDVTPVLFLTARDAIADRVAGLDAGADDYLVKPFAFEELLARLRVLLRKPAKVESNVLEVDDLSMHLDTQKVYRHGQEITLSSKEFNLLRYMMMHTGIVLSREKLEQHVWDYGYTGGSNVIDVYIRYLRKKIDDKFDKKLIHTIRGQGYVLREP